MKRFETANGLKGNFDWDGIGVSINIDELGAFTSKPGTNDGIVYLEKNDDGSVKLYVWADITIEEPTHIICLDGAHEVRRLKEETEPRKPRCWSPNG